ncbi:MAG: HAMP domain-containing sensor histidine kinase [Phycisphaerae bacterium]
MDRHPPVRTHPNDNPTTTPESAPTVEVQLVRLQTQFDLLKVQVRQAQQLTGLGTAAAMIAHEVNNLLTPILAYAQAALGSNDSELQRKALTVTMKNVRMLVAMSDRVLEISAAKPPTRESVSVREVVEDAIASLCRDLGRDGIRLSIKIDESSTVRADALQLQQVFFNLFLNAREAMVASHGGRLTVSARRQDERVIIKVHNTGEAIHFDLLPHIFDAFQTSKPVTREGRKRCGGVGLALCRDLVEENDGTIGVDSEPGTGTTFTVVLPATESTTE